MSKSRIYFTSSCLVPHGKEMKELFLSSTKEEGSMLVENETIADQWDCPEDAQLFLQEHCQNEFDYLEEDALITIQDSIKIYKMESVNHGEFRFQFN